jgi:acyl carrier protein
MAQTTQEEVFAKVRKVVAEVFKVEESRISLQTKFMDDLKAESLDIITLLMEFEEAFDKRIPDEDAEKLLSVQDAVKYIMAMEENPPQA